MSRTSVCLLFVGVLMTPALPSNAGVFLLTFEGPLDLESVDNNYDDGAGGLGSGPASNLGVSFGNAMSAANSDASGGGAFGGQSSPDAAVVPDGAGVPMNVSGGSSGSSTGSGFSHTPPFNLPFINIFDGPGETGTMPASLVPGIPLNVPSHPTGFASQFQPVSSSTGATPPVGFAQVITYPADVDNRTSGAQTDQAAAVVPEPMSVVVWFGLACIGYAMSCRRYVG